MPDYITTILIAVLAGALFLVLFYYTLYLVGRLYWRRQRMSPEDRQALLDRLDRAIKQVQKERKK